MQNLSENILTLYRNVTGYKDDDYSIIRKIFIHYKVTEPMIQSFLSIEEVTDDNHLLDDDLDEEVFAFF